MKNHFIKVTEEQGRNFFLQQKEGPVVMLNLLRFRAQADYQQSPKLKPPQPVSGWDAYQLYMEAVMPLLEETGSSVLFSGKADSFLIGPTDESWDFVLLVKHRSVNDFLAFAQMPAYQKVEGHRTAALLDSRLLPIDTKM